MNKPLKFYIRAVHRSTKMKDKYGPFTSAYQAKKAMKEKYGPGAWADDGEVKRRTTNDDDGFIDLTMYSRTDRAQRAKAK